MMRSAVREQGMAIIVEAVCHNKVPVLTPQLGLNSPEQEYAGT